MVDVAQLVRASDCGSEGRGFEPHLPPHQQKNLYRNAMQVFSFLLLNVSYSSLNNALTIGVMSMVAGPV